MGLLSFSFMAWGQDTPTYGGGSGTESDPYQISSAEHLNALATAVNGGNSYANTYFQLTADLDLSSYTSWTPIGNQKSSDYQFKGSFDGNNKSITNLTITEANENCVGLFGAISGSAELKNIHISSGSISISSAMYIGGICGYSNGSGGGTKITSCSNAASITVTNAGQGCRIGGICGDQTLGTITGCFNTGAITKSGSGTYAYTGGIVGGNQGSSVSESYNAGDISVTNTSNTSNAEAVGGLTGTTMDASLTNSYNSGNITVSGEKYYPIGGISGNLSGATTSVKYCYNVGNIQADNMTTAYLGGMFGLIFDTATGHTVEIVGCFNLGTLNVTGIEKYVGAGIGYLSYSSVTCTDNAYLSGSGLAGVGQGSDSGVSELSSSEIVTAMNTQLTSTEGWATTASYSGSTLTLPKLSDDAEEEAPTVLVWEDIEAEISPESTDGWYGSEVTLTAPEGFTISLEEDGTYAASVTYSEEGEHEVTYYLKTKDGDDPHEYTATIKIDLTAPTVEVSTNQESYTLTLSDGEGSGIASLKIDGVEVDLSELEEGVYSATGSGGTHAYEVTDKVGHTTKGEFSLESSEKPDTPQITYYDIHFVQPNDSVNFDYRSDQVREGNTFSFSASAAEGYDPKTLVVEYRRGPVGIWREATLDTDGKYHIRANYADLYIRARVEPLNPTGIEQVGDEAVEVYTEGDAIHVYTPTKERVIIVSMSGAIVRMEEQVGKRSYTGLSDGVYIVRVGERSFKVRL